MWHKGTNLCNQAKILIHKPAMLGSVGGNTGMKSRTMGKAEGNTGNEQAVQFRPFPATNTFSFRVSSPVRCQ